MNLWYDLGGEKYGGVVKDNMIKFIDIVFGMTQYDQSEVFQHKQQQIISNFSIQQSSQHSLQHKQQQIKQSPSNKQYINDSTLKLITLSNKQKHTIHKYYISMLISEQSQNILQTVLQNLSSSLQLQLPYQNISQDEINSHNQLINNAYLDSDHYRQNKLTTSPVKTPKSQEKQNDNMKKINNLDDFSPKLTSQQHQPFRSMVLQRQPIKKHHKHQQNAEITSENTQNNPSPTPTSQPTILLKPLLSVDVNLGQGLSDKLIVYEGQTPYEVSLQLKTKYNIDQELRQRFEKMLQSHMRNLLFKIQEVSEEMCQEWEDQNHNDGE